MVAMTSGVQSIFVTSSSVHRNDGRGGETLGPGQTALHRLQLHQIPRAFCSLDSDASFFDDLVRQGSSESHDGTFGSSVVEQLRTKTRVSSD